MSRLMRAIRRWANTNAIQLITTRYDCGKREKTVTRVTIETYKEPM
jgi:hypothetical protein